MSILQEYEKHKRIIGLKELKAIPDYIIHMSAEGTKLYYSDIVYKKDEWEKFINWYKKVYNNRHGKSTKRNKILQ